MAGLLLLLSVGWVEIKKMKNRISAISYLAALSLLGLGAIFPVSATLTIQDPGQGPYSIANSSSTELSGITHIGGDTYLAVSDAQAGFYSLSITINPAAGSINSASVGGFTAFAGGSDYEGIAYNPANMSVFASSETNSSIGEFQISTGALLENVVVPSVFANARSNKSLESLSYEAGFQTLWTANEEALSTDGDASSAGSGTTVRLQKFDQHLNPAGQWAYHVDPATENIPFPPASSFSGLSDLVALPDGRLLALERELGGPTPGIRNRIYSLDFNGATDTSALAGLAGESFIPVNKTLLWEEDFDLLDISNFEGMVLGPTLNNGDYSLLLISDDAGNQLAENLYALTLSGVNPVPVPPAVVLFGSSLIFLAFFRIGSIRGFI